MSVKDTLMSVGEADTLPKLIKRNYETWGDRVAFRDKEFGIWQEYTWKECYEHFKRLALGMMALGLKPGDHVSFIGDNEPQYYWGMFATMAGGGAAVAMYVDSIPPEIEYIVDHSQSKFVFCRDQEQVDKLISIKDKLPTVEKIFWWYPKGMRKYEEPYLMGYNELTALGNEYEKLHPGLFEDMVAKANPDDTCQIFYTSGTTGLPKGALQSHKAMIGSCMAWMQRFPMNETDRVLCYLPPAWVGEAFFSYIPALLVGASLNTLEEPETVWENMREVAPVVVLGGPRQWEGWVSRIRARITEAGAIESFLYNLLLPVGLKVAELHFAGKKVGIFWGFLNKYIAYPLLFRPIRDWLGLPRVRLGATGGAVTSMEILRFMRALGVNIFQLYGSTEGGMVTTWEKDNLNYASIGTPLVGCELRISDESEILSRGEYLLTGFWRNPEATAKTLIDGWWYSGDGAFLDEDGYVMYQDRVSEMGQLRSGARYAPQFIESSLRFSPYIKDVMVVGEEEDDYVTAIVNIDFENVGRWAEKHHLPYTTFTDLSQKEEVGKLVKDDISRVNRNLPEAIRVKRYFCLHKEFDPDEADLTRTRKLKRVSLRKRYEGPLKDMYQGKSESIFEVPVTYQDGRTGTLKASLKIWEVF